MSLLFNINDYNVEWKPRSDTTEISTMGDIRRKSDGFVYHISGQTEKVGDIIICNETNTIFLSQKWCAKWLDIPVPYVNMVVNGKMKHAKGYTFTRLSKYRD